VVGDSGIVVEDAAVEVVEDETIATELDVVAVDEVVEDDAGVVDLLVVEIAEEVVLTAAVEVARAVEDVVRNVEDVARTVEDVVRRVLVIGEAAAVVVEYLVVDLVVDCVVDLVVVRVVDTFGVVVFFDLVVVGHGLVLYTVFQMIFVLTTCFVLGYPMQRQNVPN
jgi:hypothetical protein